jgi:hypothetical protein
MQSQRYQSTVAQDEFRFVRRCALEGEDAPHPVLIVGDDIITTTAEKSKSVNVNEQNKAIPYVRIPIRAPPHPNQRPKASVGGFPAQVQGRRLLLHMGSNMRVVSLLSRTKQRAEPSAASSVAGGSAQASAMGAAKRRAVPAPKQLPSEYQNITAVVRLYEGDVPSDAEVERQNKLDQVLNRLRELVLHNRVVCGDASMDERDTRRLKLHHTNSNPDYLPTNPVDGFVQSPVIYLDIVAPGASYWTTLIWEQDPFDGSVSKLDADTFVAKYSNTSFPMTTVALIDSIVINPSGTWSVKLMAHEIFVKPTTTTCGGGDADAGVMSSLFGTAAVVTDDGTVLQANDNGNIVEVTSVRVTGQTPSQPDADDVPTPIADRRSPSPEVPRDASDLLSDADHLLLQ